MRTTLLFCLALSSSLLARAQWGAPRPSVHLEVGGASPFVGLHYDARVAPASPWGYRLGLSYAAGSSDDVSMFKGLRQDDRCVMLPLSLYRLHGQGKHHLEWGLGANVGYYWHSGKPSPFGKWEEGIKGFLTGTLGYRYQPARGLVLRAGVSPCLPLTGSYAVPDDDLLVSPYISIGYAF